MHISHSFESKEKQWKYWDFVAFTSTFYRDDIEWRTRSEACFEMLDNAQKLGIMVMLWDGGSCIAFLERLSKYPNVTIVQSWKWWENSDLSMGWERRFTGKKAMEIFPDARYFLWLEPEKSDLMKSETIDDLLFPMRSWKVDMVVPSRKSKETLPSQQRAVENRANLRAMDIINNKVLLPIHVFTWRKYGWDDPIISSIVKVDPKQKSVYVTPAKYDLWFGPKLFNRLSMEENFLAYDWKKWDAIITPVLIGKQQWKTILDIPVDFSYLQTQTQLETDPSEAEKYQKKRITQYGYIMRILKELVTQV